MEIQAFQKCIPDQVWLSMYTTSFVMSGWQTRTPRHEILWDFPKMAMSWPYPPTFVLIVNTYLCCLSSPLEHFINKDCVGTITYVMVNSSYMLYVTGLVPTFKAYLKVIPYLSKKLPNAKRVFPAHFKPKPHRRILLVSMSLIKQCFWILWPSFERSTSFATYSFQMTGNIALISKPRCIMHYLGWNKRRHSVAWIMWVTEDRCELSYGLAQRITASGWTRTQWKVITIQTNDSFDFVEMISWAKDQVYALRKFVTEEVFNTHPIPPITQTVLSELSQPVTEARSDLPDLRTSYLNQP